MKKYLLSLFVLLLIATGCAQKTEEEKIDITEPTITSETMENSQETVEAPIFEFKDDITLTGTVTEQTYIESENDVTITLDNMSATLTEPLIYVEEAKSVTIILKGENTINVSGIDVKAIDSRDDLIFKGEGTLNITSDDTAIKSNDDLTIESGTYNIVALGDGVKANETLHIEGGTLNIEAKEAIEATEIIIDDGVINVKATDDGINASAKSSKNLQPVITINGGEINIEMGQGDTDAIDSNGDLYINGGLINIKAQFGFDCDGIAELNGGEVYLNGQQITNLQSAMIQIGGGPMNHNQMQGMQPGTRPEGFGGQMPPGGQMPQGEQPPTMPQQQNP